MEALVGRFPKAPDNDAGLKLDRVTRRLGIRLVWDGKTPSTIDDQKLYDSLTAWAKKLREPNEPGFPRPPADAIAFIDEHHAEMEKVVQLLSSSEPSWASDIAMLPPPIPSLLAHRTLHLLLVVDVVQRLLRRDESGAHEVLSSAWRQRLSLSARSDLVSQLIAITIAEEETAVLRRWPAAPAEWTSRLGHGSFRERFLLAFQAETYSWLTLTREHRGFGDLEGRDSSPSVIRRALRFGSAPYVRLAMAGVSGRMRHVRSLAAVDDGCELDGDALAAEAVADVPRWNILPKTVLSSFVRAWPVAVVADLDSELTTLVLDSRRRPEPGARSSPLPSRVCVETVAGPFAAKRVAAASSSWQASPRESTNPAD